MLQNYVFKYVFFGNHLYLRVGINLLFPQLRANCGQAKNKASQNHS